MFLAVCQNSAIVTFDGFSQATMEIRFIKYIKYVKVTNCICLFPHIPTFLKVTEFMDM